MVVERALLQASVSASAADLLEANASPTATADGMSSTAWEEATADITLPTAWEKAAYIKAFNLACLPKPPALGSSTTAPTIPTLTQSYRLPSRFIRQFRLSTHLVPFRTGCSRITWRCCWRRC